jgi:hypothetical protein
MRNLFRVSGLATAALILVAACSSTKLVHSWSLPGFKSTTVKKILVLGISTNPAIRRTFEDTFVEDLKKLGYTAVPGYLWAPDATNVDRDAMAAKIRENNVTNVLVTRMVASKDVETYYAPTAVGVGYGGYGVYGPAYYGSWSGYYSYGYTTMVSPGYTTTNTVVTLETNFYDASKEKDALVWSGTSETWTDQAQSGSKVNEVISALVYGMRARGVI